MNANVNVPVNVNAVAPPPTKGPPTMMIVGGVVLLLVIIIIVVLFTRPAPTPVPAPVPAPAPQPQKEEKPLHEKEMKKVVEPARPESKMGAKVADVASPGAPSETRGPAP
jgi:hypothetical protein